MKEETIKTAIKNIEDLLEKNKGKDKFGRPFDGSSTEELLLLNSKIFRSQLDSPHLPIEEKTNLMISMLLFFLLSENEPFIDVILLSTKELINATLSKK